MIRLSTLLVAVLLVAGVLSDTLAGYDVDAVLRQELEAYTQGGATTSVTDLYRVTASE
ncbi:hypothetical protein KIPB_005767, partial [Kipferlia bialata]|eukprot:g5767.t1